MRWNDMRWNDIQRVNAIAKLGFSNYQVSFLLFIFQNQMSSTQRVPIPLSQRNLDRFLFIPFFILNISFITYLVDIEQITTLPPVDGKPYPIWPPKGTL